MVDTASSAAARFSNMPVASQVGLLLGLAASIALGIWVVMWAKEPVYQPLYSNLTSRDAADVVDVLQRNNILFRVDKDTGSISVATNKVHDARMKLAQEGLPASGGRGYEMFSNSSAFTTSQFMESARYRHALETELSRTISKFKNIKSARVHLAIPRQSAFVRNAKTPSASVFVDVFSSVELRNSTVASIVSMVASSVPSLTSSHVTVVDQNGQLLSEGGGSSVMSMTDKFFDYRQQLEKAYADRIRNLLIPIVGVGKVRANVSAEIDFTSSEQTREMYNPDLPAIRSEQKLEEKKAISQDTGGIVGATANQPRNAATNTDRAATTETTAGASDFRTQSTKNFELDKTISHTKQQPGRIKRLSVAVLLDDKALYDEKTGKSTNLALTPEEINKIKTLVADAVGLDTKRGDSLNVINASFAAPAPIEEVPAESIVSKGWFWSVIKQVSAGIFILILVFGILKPTIRALAANNKMRINLNAGGEGGGELQLGSGGAKAAQTPEERMQAVKTLAGQDPKGVASVVKTWVDGG